MNAKNLSMADIINLYQTRYAQSGYPFKHSENQGKDFVETEWLKIKLKPEKTQPELLPFIITINEIFRFEIGNTQPECRLAENHMLSKRIKQDNVEELQVRTLYYYYHQFVANQNLYWEGLGRVVFCRYFYHDNDFNLYNGLVDINNCFIAIDLEQCLWPLTEKYHHGPNKIINQPKFVLTNNTPFTVEFIFSQLGQPAYLIKGKTREFIGELHKDDYEILPRINHFYPTSWFLIMPEFDAYAKSLSRNIRFLNEKHFATLKLLVTMNVKKILINLHLQNENDKNDCIDFISAQLLKLTEICKQSEAFKNYLRANHETALKTIMVEISEFFNNKAYKFADESLQQSILDIIYTDVNDQYQNLLIEMNIPQGMDYLADQVS